MLKRRTTGSVICPACGSLVGVNDDKCYSCGRSNPGMWGFAPALRQLGSDLGFVPLVIGTCGVLYALSLLASGGAVGGRGGLDFLSPSSAALSMFGASGAFPVFIEGRWWTVLAASWLHAGLVHIVFNLMAVRNIGPLAIDLIGPGRTVIVYVLSGAAGFLLTSAVRVYFPYLPYLHGAVTTVGASASICGLLGAITHYGQKSGSSLIRSQTSQWAIMLAVSGVILPGVDNVAHLGGFAGGYAISAMFNPLTKERGDHMLAAVLCLVASLLAILASVWVGWTRI